VRLADDGGDDRCNEVFHERGDNGSEGRADDDRDGKIHDIAAMNFFSADRSMCQHLAPTDTYRSNFFAKVAFADVIAVVDFTLTFVSGAYIVYPSGIVVALVAVTIALAQGVTLEVVSRMVRHSSVSVTFDVYAHLVPALQRQAADAMDGALRRAE
jgi:hypothetical protein